MSCPTIALKGTRHAVPAIGYGTWLAKPGEVYEGVKAAIAAGYRHIDAAWIYGNEEEVGRAIKDKLEDGTLGSRADLFVTSKLWNNFHRPERVLEGCKDSLTKLGLDYLDLYLVHFPVAFVPDCTEAVRADQVDKVPLVDTWKAMEGLVDAGLARNIGVSNFEIEHLKEVQAVATKPIAMNQFEMHPYYQRTALVDYCHENHIAVTAHTSMGGAANIMAKHAASPPLKDDATVAAIAQKHNATPHAVLLKWGLQRGVCIIPKSVTPSRIMDNLTKPQAVTLDDDDMKALAGLDKPGLEGCFCHPKTAWLGRSEFTGTMHYYN